MKFCILTTIAGAGHNQAARAIHKALLAEAPGHQVVYMDAAELGTPLVRQTYNDSYLKMVGRLPALWGFFYDRYDKKRLSRGKQKLKELFALVNSRPLRRRLKEEAPDVVVATHFYPAEIALRQRAKGRIKSRVEVVLTDFMPHRFWVLDGVDRYFVAGDETRFNLAARGVAQERIAVTGIPVDPKFARAHDRRDIRARLGLDPDAFTVLVASGGMGLGPMGEVVQTLLAHGRVKQILVVCGRNEKLKMTLDGMRAPHGTLLSVFGFVDTMDDLMAASDLLVSKCGGLTTSESLALGVPMLILNPIPGQESHNSDFLLERGAALKASDVHGLRYKIDRVLDEPALLSNMRSAVGKIARPDAARDVARILTDSNRL
jgi:processive 1,2-diacylglycerol beta-glucosyltransferase